MANGFELEISQEQLCQIIALAHDYEMQGDEAEENTPADVEGEHPSTYDDDEGDASEDLLRNFIQELDEDEQIDLVALAWLGRGDDEFSNWNALRAKAAAAHNDRTARYLLGMPMLPDLLEEGMSAFGLSCED